MATSRATPQSSSPEEDTSSGSHSPSDHDEVEQQQHAKKPLLPVAPAEQENGSSDDDETDEEESEDEVGENEAPTQNLLRPPSPPQASQGADELEQQGTKNPSLPLALANQDNGGPDDDDSGEEESDDETGGNGAATQNLLRPQPPQGNHGSEYEYDSGESDSDSDEVPPRPMLPKVMPTVKPQPKRKVPSGEIADSPQPREKAPLADLPQLKTKTQPAELPQLKRNMQAENNVEKLFEGKCETYWFLGTEVLALEAKRPGLYRVPFLKLADDKARTLDNKLKKHMMTQVKTQLRRGDVEKEVTNTLINLLKG